MDRKGNNRRVPVKHSVDALQCQGITRKAEFYRVVMLGRKGHVEKAIFIWKIDYFTDIGSN